MVLLAMENVWNEFLNGFYIRLAIDSKRSRLSNVCSKAFKLITRSDWRSSLLNGWSILYELSMSKQTQRSTQIAMQSKFILIQRKNLAAYSQTERCEIKSFNEWLRCDVMHQNTACGMGSDWNESVRWRCRQVKQHFHLTTERFGTRIRYMNSI